MNVVPSPSCEETSIFPPCSVIMRFTIASPMPIPVSFVVKYRSKIFDIFSSGIPTGGGSDVLVTQWVRGLGIGGDGASLLGGITKDLCRCRSHRLCPRFHRRGSVRAKIIIRPAKNHVICGSSLRSPVLTGGGGRRAAVPTPDRGGVGVRLPSRNHHAVVLRRRRQPAGGVRLAPRQCHRRG